MRRDDDVRRAHLLCNSLSFAADPGGPPATPLFVASLNAIVDVYRVDVCRVVVARTHRRFTPSVLRRFVPSSPSIDESRDESRDE
jgi:hypothetical protein